MLLLQAEAINVMDIPGGEKRKEVSEAKERMKGYHRSAKDRFVILSGFILFVHSTHYFPLFVFILSFKVPL